MATSQHLLSTVCQDYAKTSYKYTVLIRHPQIVYYYYIHFMRKQYKQVVCQGQMEDHESEPEVGLQKHVLLTTDPRTPSLTPDR